MKEFDYSYTEQSNIATPEQEKMHLLQSCATKQYLTCGVSVVSDPSNSGVHNVSQATKFCMVVSHIYSNIYCSLFPRKKMRIGSHAPSRKHPITISFTVHSSTVRSQRGTCFLSPFGS